MKDKTLKTVFNKPNVLRVKLSDNEIITAH